MDFSGKLVLVTGSSRGIGNAAARLFHECGARVAINGRTEGSTRAAIADFGDRVVAAPGDVATAAGCETIVAAALEGLGGLDVLVNSAGVFQTGPIEDFDEAAWDRMIDTNMKGTFFCTRAALGALRASQGSIVNLSSESGLIGQPGSAIYCASKGGVTLMTRSLALELAPEVRINCVCPGWVDTDMARRDYINSSDDPAAALASVEADSPMARMAKPEEVAASILYLASDVAGFVTGVALAIDGGSTASR
jgi:NAD(P)-dependent dehydrogenase (short-subunit alcohol dehydrogenase family)